MKGKIIKNPQLDVFQIPLISVINMDHELVILAQRIDWKSVDKEFSIYYPYMGRQAVPVRKMVGSMILKQMYNLGDETFVARWIENPYWQYYRVLGQKRDDNNKIYSFHAPEVKCISKGKEHKRYEFGNKSSFVLTK